MDIAHPFIETAFAIVRFILSRAVYCKGRHNWRLTTFNQTDLPHFFIIQFLLTERDVIISLILL